MSVSAPKAGARGKEVTVVHTRILRNMLAPEDSQAYWQRVDLAVPPAQRAALAFEQRWFGTKSEARVRTLIGDMLERFDAFPEALGLLASMPSVPARLRPWICHLHLQLADPIYRRFSGELLPQRRAEGYRTIDRPAVSRWISEIEPERWSAATCNKFASNLLATALEVGLITGRRDPRSLTPKHVPSEAIGYALYLLRTVDIQASLLDSPYLRSLDVDLLSLATSLNVPGFSCARVGDLVDITWGEPSLTEWGQRYVEAAA